MVLFFSVWSNYILLNSNSRSIVILVSHNEVYYAMTGLKHVNIDPHLVFGTSISNEKVFSLQNSTNV